jgi:hypothetical protein
VALFAATIRFSMILDWLVLRREVDELAPKTGLARRRDERALEVPDS